MKTSCGGDPGCRATRIQVSGGSWPTQIWGAYMARAASSGYAVAGFSSPGGTTTATIDSRTGCLAKGSTPDEFAVTATFLAGKGPKKSCPVPDELKTKDEKKTVVPAVEGMSEDDAVERLEDAGFKVEVITEKEEDKDEAKENKGLVWLQDPSGGDRANPGSTVTIWVNP